MEIADGEDWCDGCQKVRCKARWKVVCRRGARLEMVSFSRGTEVSVTGPPGALLFNVKPEVTLK